jgi:hypothetical protein
MAIDHFETMPPGFASTFRFPFSAIENTIPDFLS